MGTYKEFKSSERHETEGVVADLGESGRFTIARAGGTNKRYIQRLEALMRPHRRALASNTLSNEVAEKVLHRVFAETVVIGWEGVTGPDNQPLPFSIENAIKLFADLPDLFAVIRDTASDASIFREFSEADTKN